MCALGRDDDAVWAEAEAITQFREFQPRIDSAPRYRTEAKITYDASHLYAFVRMFDPHPDSIVSLLYVLADGASTEIAVTGNEGVMVTERWSSARHATLPRRRRWCRPSGRRSPSASPSRDRQVR